MFKTNTQYIKDNMVIKKSKLNILIIDENKTSFDSLKNILESRGHSINIITEPIRCITDIIKNIYDIILIDNKLCDIADTQLIELIKTVLNYKPIIFAYSDDNKYNKKNLNVNAIINKPNNLKDINKIIKLFETIKIIDKSNIDNSLFLINKK